MFHVDSLMPQLYKPRKLEYKPTSYNQSPIIYKKAKHSFTYIMSSPLDEVDRGGSAYQELLSRVQLMI